MTRRRKKRHALVTFACVCLGLILALSVTACGGGSSSSSGGSTGDSGGSTGEGEGSSGSSEATTAKAELAKLYKGDFGKPATKAPAVEPGKNVWAIVVSYQVAASKLEAEEFKAGAEELGWKPTLKDGKFNPTEELSEVREAIRANADAIWLEAIDCEPIKAGLEEAKKAGIVIVASNSQDCAQPLFTAETEFEAGDASADNHRAGEAQAIWAIAETDAEAKVLLAYENDIVGTKEINEGAKERFEQCSGCEIVGEVTFTGAELGPALQQKVEQALLKYPDATVVDGNYDGAVENGVAAAVRGSGRQIPVLGGEGQPNNIELVRNGEQAMGFGYPFGWVAYSGLDAILRLLGGEKEVGNSGAGLQVFDAKHNLPPEGEAFRPSFDYKQAYREAWGL